MNWVSQLSRRSALSFLLSACAAAPFPRSGSQQGTSSDSERLAAALEDSSEEQVRLTPQMATFRGDLRYADQFGDLITDDFIRAYEAFARRDVARLGEIDRARLTPNEQIAYDVFAYQAEFTLRSYESGAAAVFQQDFALNHLNGRHLFFPQLLSGQGGFAFSTTESYEIALRLMEGFAVYLDRAREYMARGIDRGNVHSRVASDRIVTQLRAALEAGVEGSPLLRPTRNFPASVASGERERLTAAFREKLTDRVMPAYQQLLTFFELDYAPASRTGVPGLAALPNGRRLYAYNLELHTTTQMTADEIHEIGHSEVARIRRAMEDIKAGVGFGGAMAEFSAHLRTSPMFKFSSREALIDAYSEVRARVEPLLHRYFSRLPRAPFEIRPVPPELESAVPGAYVQLGTPDGARPSIFFVNTSNLPTRTSPRVTSIFLHEAQPGHLLQAPLAQEDESLPALLRFNRNAGYTEGWALYAESLGVEMGLYDNPYQRFGALDLEMLRAARLVIDTGLHAKGWSREQSIAFMEANTTLDQTEIVQEIDRYIVEPGQASSYKIGEIVIQRLREYAEQSLGERFDIRGFHDQILNSGSIPLGVLDRKIRRWVESLSDRRAHHLTR